MTMDELQVFARCGALGGLPRLELLDGVLYETHPQTRRHTVAKNELAFQMRIALQDGDLSLSVLTEPTLQTATTSAPEPDIDVLTQLRVEGFYPASLVKLTVEIAVTTVSTDLGYKKSLYASARIPEYWVVDVDGGCIHQFWSSEDGGYAESRVIRIGETLRSMTIVGCQWGQRG